MIMQNEYFKIKTFSKAVNKINIPFEINRILSLAKYFKKTLYWNIANNKQDSKAFCHCLLMVKNLG